MIFSGEPEHTFLSLAEYANILGLDPIQFFQGVSDLRSIQNCDDVWYQFANQDGGKISREELKQAIYQAEQDIIKQVGYFPAPYWHTEILDYPRLYINEHKGLTGRRRGDYGYKTIEASKKHVISGGIRAATKIDQSEVTRNSDIDTTGDGFDDTASFTITNIDFTNICELQAFFKEFDPLDAQNTRTDPSSEGADNKWQVRPIRAKLTDTTATVYVPKYLLFKPQLQRRINADVIDADLATSYVDTLEFYRVYNDPSSMATFLWDNETICNDSGCTSATQPGCIRVNDSRRGILSVQPASYDSDTNSFDIGYFSYNTEPNRVLVNYYSGDREQANNSCYYLSNFWAQNIAILATAHLNKQVCACENVARRVEMWQEDLSLNVEARTFTVGFEDLQNPFGTQYGSVYVWNRIKNRGIKIGKRIKA